MSHSQTTPSKEGWSGNETRASPVCLWEQDFDEVSGESASTPCHSTHPSPNIKISLSTIAMNTRHVTTPTIFSLVFQSKGVFFTCSTMSRLLLAMYSVRMAHDFCWQSMVAPRNCTTQGHWS